ncbi:hypothetical protein ABB33_13580 [Stenotrophomonas acidaminiphila]|nr:hypothetical protein ABB33_13580 [Stenotrophomonas acidaminiphila]
MLSLPHLTIRAKAVDVQCSVGDLKPDAVNNLLHVLPSAGIVYDLGGVAACADHQDAQAVLVQGICDTAIHQTIAGQQAGAV